MTPVDLYCERITPGLWAEPLNAATNAAFLIAAWFAWRYVRRSGKPAGGVLVLVGLTIAFALGSALFHTFANPFTRVLDALPIALFIVVYLWLYLRQVLNATVLTAVLCSLVFVTAAIVARQSPDILNGSVIYAPALVLVTALGCVHLAKAQRERGALIGAAGVFLASLIFRTIDNLVCAAFSIGTHFLWHLLTALALYVAMRALTANVPARISARSASAP